jgi:hypothetical protein
MKENLPRFDTGMTSEAALFVDLVRLEGGIVTARGSDGNLYAAGVFGRVCQ